MQRVWQLGLPVIAVALLAAGAYFGLLIAPPEAFMGDVYRIMFVHVPTAWAAMLGFSICFGASLFYMFRSDLRADALAEAAAEVGVVFATLLLITGSIWGRPAWGVWWTWDPRLTTAAIMWLAFSGYLALRRFVDVPEKRAAWSAVVAIVIFVDIPIVWFSVKWWNSLHQVQSNAGTLGSSMRQALALNSLAYVVTFAWFTSLRYRIGRRRQAAELAAPPDDVAEGAV
jgi:heme exporter protein C